MGTEQIGCIFFGDKADIAKRNGKLVVLCRRCNSVTASDTNQEMFDRWLGDVRKREA